MEERNELKNNKETNENEQNNNKVVKEELHLLNEKVNINYESK